jgi:hypothetical protein
MMLTDLADILRRASLPVVEVSGWKNRSNDGNRFAGVRAIVCHWTATAPSAAGDYPSLNIVTNGRSDLPGMLAQLGLGRNGTWYVIGAGVAWHAGVVDTADHDNWHAIGIEAEYHPDQGPWPDVQQRSYERGCAALANHYGVPLWQIQGHYEVARPVGRKPDPNTLPGGMSGFRQRVAAVNLEEDDMAGEGPEILALLRNLDNWLLKGGPGPDAAYAGKAVPGLGRSSAVAVLHDNNKALRAVYELTGKPIGAVLVELLNRDPVDLDEAAVATALLPALTAAVDRLGDAELTRVAQAVADEQDRRARDNDPTTGPTS